MKIVLLLLCSLPAAEAMARHRYARINIPGLSSSKRAKRVTRGVHHQPLVATPAVAAFGLGGVALAAAVLGSGVSAQGRRWLRGQFMPRRETLVSEYAIADRTLVQPGVAESASALLEVLRAGGEASAVAVKSASVQEREASVALAIVDFCRKLYRAPSAAALPELKRVAAAAGDISLARAFRMATTSVAGKHGGRPMPESPELAAKESAAGALLLLCGGALLHDVRHIYI